VQYGEERILNVTVFGLRDLGRTIWRGTDTECYCVCFEGLGRAIL